VAYVERLCRTLSDGVNTLILSSGLPDRFYGHAFLTMVYLRNRSCSKGASKLPYTSLIGHDPDLSNLRVFGCLAYVIIASSQSSKFPPKHGKGLLLAAPLTPQSCSSTIPLPTR